MTARLTPPLNPNNNLGYLEYGENEFADVQGEDSDDFIRFTAKAPAGRPFTGRMWVPPPIPISSMSALQFQYYLATQPITINSEYAEIIYFLRNGSLYRRVLLVAPERQSSMATTVNNVWIYNDPVTGLANNPFNPTALGGNAVSWQAVNDVSAHPAPTGTPFNNNSVILNTLSDLTNRENRFAYQRFSNDFLSLTGAAPPDGLSDDFNGDNVPDYYPTLYPTVTYTTATIGPGPPQNLAGNPIQLIFEPAPPTVGRPAIGLMSFPFVFPGAYSRPQTLSTAAYGWIHSPEPDVFYNGGPVQFDASPLAYLQNVNHNPIDLGDNLPLPSSGSPGGFQTWWGFPTWRETLSLLWNDPTLQVNAIPSQPAGLAYILANSPLPAGTPLPPMTATYRGNPQPYNDELPTTSNFFFPLDVSNNPPPLWYQYSWEDDLIMTGVRSFDIKAYDNTLARYADLGWGDDLRLYQPYNGVPGAVIPGAAPGLSGTPSLTVWPPVNPTVNPLGQYFNTLTQTFAHEGRMPPLIEDYRYDAQFGAVLYSGYNYTGNIGDDNPAVVRLRRVWDSWSTEYTQAPGTGVYPAGTAAASFPAGPPLAPPIYPSYPPPYPAPLRGIQIQIRVTDPASQRIKVLTIRQDFTDKL